MGVGRKPVPTALKILKGTDQPCRVNNNEPMPDNDNIKPPPDLSLLAKKHWNQISGQLEKIGILTNIDVTALEIYCETYAQWKDATDNINELGAVIEGKDGFPTRSPYLMVAQKSFEQMRSMLTEFGMTPSSRTRLSVPEPKKKNSFAD